MSRRRRPARSDSNACRPPEATIARGRRDIPPVNRGAVQERPAPAPHRGADNPFMGLTRLSLRIGRACVQYGIREFGGALGLTTAAFRLLPLPGKLRAASKALADLFNNQTDQRVRVEEQPGMLFWHIERCPLCWERRTNEPACHLAVGLVQEGLYWLSGGKIFIVEETACVAQGDPACTLRVDESPIS